jgi:ATP-dependent DNA helicase RecQ
LLEILAKVPGTGIVYCRNRRRTKEIANLLKLNNISADFYHAGLPQNERNQKQEDWIKSKVRVIVCTNAFGMGIDKPDVRVVVHMDIPDNLENYYQEAGRAGRDGKNAFAVLLYSKEELEELRKLPEVKYPPFAEIKKVYQALANHLHVPVGSGEGQYHDFNLKDFVLYFKLDVFLVANALKALEQEGHLTFNEQVFSPSKVSFSCDRQTLTDFEISNPHLDLLIKSLLRSYEGIFDNIVSIHEAGLSRMNKTTVPQVVEQLKQLHALGLINYQPQKETPQIFFLQNRAPSEHINFNHQSYLKRKQEYQLRIDAMEGYIMLENKCRSQYVGNYFGDQNMKLCGMCDNCLAQKNVQLTTEEFKIITGSIFHSLTGTALEVKTLLLILRMHKKDKVWKVLNYLQSEGQLKVNEKGSVERA